MKDQNENAPVATAPAQLAIVEQKGKQMVVRESRYIVRDTRVKVPCFESKAGAKDSVRLDAGVWSQTVGTSASLKVKVQALSAHILGIEDVSVSFEVVSGYDDHKWSEFLIITVPRIAFNLLGLLGLAERVQTNCRNQPRQTLYGILLAFTNGGMNLSTVGSFLVETAEEKAARLEKDRLEAEAKAKKELAEEIKVFKKLVLATKGITDVQKETIGKMAANDLLAISGNMMLSDKWPGLLEAAQKAEFKWIETDLKKSDLF